jgi:hypothetical protein
MILRLPHNLHGFMGISVCSQPTLGGDAICGKIDEAHCNIRLGAELTHGNEAARRKVHGLVDITTLELVVGGNETLTKQHLLARFERPTQRALPVRNFALNAREPRGTRRGFILRFESLGQIQKRCGMAARQGPRVAARGELFPPILGEGLPQPIARFGTRRIRRPCAQSRLAVTKARRTRRPAS